ncbi:hypothetical protein V0288_20235 [Pannus brasiliensis CCIBt3594]|uniref:WYL domain-containing protein n=1 Tax=Pannus brasiliensis CCIBt3594 TaxID=1427578 RepID=A0AAW9QXV8_9CHRO
MNEIILKILSDPRDPKCLTRPVPLNKTQIVTLLRDSIPPDRSLDKLADEVQESLQELEARGEILAGVRNRYCIAPPAVVSIDGDSENHFHFRGDRAYLPLVHRILETGQDSEAIELHPRVDIGRIKPLLNRSGIRFFTLDESLHYLPTPYRPLTNHLRASRSEEYIDFDTAIIYIPSPNTIQRERWRKFDRSLLAEESLFRLKTGEYLWYQDRQYHELEADTGVLMMYYLDRNKKCPLEIPWDRSLGKLYLRGIFLPGAYYQLILQLSKPDGEITRTRRIAPANFPLIEKAFEKIGCILVESEGES